MRGALGLVASTDAVRKLKYLDWDSHALYDVLVRTVEDLNL